MARLRRPGIPLEVRCRVALRQLGEMWPDGAIAAAVEQRALGDMLRGLLAKLADLQGCTEADLRLDHDPALGARQKTFNKAGEHVDYVPGANDPEHLNYRPHAPGFDRSHLIKTNVRGEHGQHPDRVLIKKQRRLEAKERGEVRPKVGFQKGAKLRSASRWPKGRTIANRKTLERSK